MSDGVMLDFAGGDVFDKLLSVNMDLGMLRPYQCRDGKVRASLLTNQIDDNTGARKRKEFVVNTTTTMTREAWLMFDTQVIEAAKAKLMAWQRLRSVGTLTIPDGMAVTKLEQQRRGDITPAIISMDGLRQGEADLPQYDDISLPLPIIHKDADFSARDVAVSRRGGQPLDVTNIRLAGEMVALAVEELLLGIRPVYRYAGSAVYGYTNFPSRLTKVITSPALGGWTPAQARLEVIAAIKQLIAQFHNGPFDILYGLGWYEYMQQAYSTLYDSETLVDVIRKLDKVGSVEMSDLLTGYQLIFTERNPATQRAVVGMDITTVQWESHGGMKKHYKVMAIMVPQLRADILGQTGILHANVA